MINESRITLDEQLEKQSIWSLRKCSKCLLKQKGIAMNYENLFMDIICHNRILCTAGMYCIFGETEKDSQDTLLSFVRKI